jgi:hypothetical protein
MSIENEALVRRFFDDFCTGRRADLADELISADYVSHVPQAPPAEGPQGVVERVGLYQEACDGVWRVDDICSIDNRVVTSWTGIGTSVS